MSNQHGICRQYKLWDFDMPAYWEGVGRWVAKEIFLIPAFWQVSITSTMR
jgi:hypothetical protein